MAKAEFIGLHALTHIADQFAPQIIMGASYFRPEEMDRLHIKVIFGIQFRNTATVMARKGGTTRRKVVGKKVDNPIGFLKERAFTAKLTMNRFSDNQDNYVETPYQVEGSSDYSYPMSEAAFKAITATYGEDLFANLFHGDLANDENGEKGALSLFDGFLTCIKHDVEDGLISEAMGNLVNCDAITAPTSSTDTAAWDAFCAWQQKWNGSLKNQLKVIVYCSTKTGTALARAYANVWHGNQGVRYLQVNGIETYNFTVPEYPNIEFAPSDIYGEGDKLIATIPENFQYGVNSEDSRSKISVKLGSDTDNLDITFQVESIQGARLLNPFASAFCMSNGTLVEKVVLGDFTRAIFAVSANDDALGTVTVNSAAPDPKKDYAANETLTLKATPKGSNKFVKWSNGKTTPEITVVTTGYPDAIVALFSK